MREYRNAFSRLGVEVRNVPLSLATFPPLRSSSFAPTSSSSERICEEMAGCVRKRRSAAREKLLSRSTSRNVSI